MQKKNIAIIIGILGLIFLILIAMGIYFGATRQTIVPDKDSEFCKENSATYKPTTGSTIRVNVELCGTPTFTYREGQSAFFSDGDYVVFDCSGILYKAISGLSNSFIEYGPNGVTGDVEQVNNPFTYFMHPRNRETPKFICWDAYPKRTSVYTYVDLRLLNLNYVIPECTGDEEECKGENEKVWYICTSDNTWQEKGITLNKCGVECLSGIDCDSGFKCDNYNCVEKSKIIVYRFADNECTEIEIYPEDKTENDYDTLENCKGNIIPDPIPDPNPEPPNPIDYIPYIIGGLIIIILLLIIIILLIKK